MERLITSQKPEEMGSASKTSCNISSHCIGEVDTAVKLEPKMMVKEYMTGGNREHGRKISVLLQNILKIHSKEMATFNK